MASGYKALSWDAKIDAELAEWPGVAYRREGGRKHQRLYLSFDGRERFVVYPSSPSEYRGLQNKITDIRKELTGLGANRNERRKAKVHREHNRPNRNPLANVAAAPVKPNPFEVLQAIEFAPERVSIWHRAAQAMVAVWRRLKGSVLSTTSAARRVRP
jgi:hypothetical protein